MATPIPRNEAEVTVHEAAIATGGTVVREGPIGRVVGIASDTRAVVAGNAFVALRGEHHDGHAFIGEAAARGAALVIVDRDCDVPPGPAIVRVDDGLAAWGALAQDHVARWRRAGVEGRIVAITGSAGKTTTKELCAALLRENAPTHASAGNLNNLVGVPAVLFALTPSHRFAIVECGMSVRGEIARLAEIVGADVAVITNVSIAHAEGVGGNREDVAREKGALFGALDSRGTCVFDADDELCTALAERCPGRRVGFGRAERAAYRLSKRVSRGREGSYVTIARPHGSPITIELPLVGEAAAIDLCAALAAAEAVAGAITEDHIASAMKRVRSTSGRVTLHELDRNILVIDDTYNANPASMLAALDTLAELANGRRRVAVLGEMKELGVRAADEHAALGDMVARSGVGLVIGCGGLMSVAIARARSLGVEAIDCANVADASAATRERVGPGDVVLVKGSRSVGTERVLAALGVRGAT
jgi:UDP-N-acetylmuramoyl-tripeptide--D-alanyl-D-alanine ligase